MIQPLRTPGEFRALRTDGRRVTEGPITVIAAPAGEDQHTQVAYAISRRVGTAVRRNRLRRQLRAVLARFDRAGELPAARYLVICEPQATTLGSSGLNSCLDGALRRVSILP